LARENSKMVFERRRPDNYHLGMNRLAELLQEAGITGAELARRVGVQQPQIWRLINYPAGKNSRKMTKEWAERIAPALGVTPADLLFEPRHSKGADSGKAKVVSSVDDDLKRSKREIIFEADVRGGAGGGGIRSEERVTFDHNGNTYAAEGVAGEWSLPGPVVSGLLRASPKDILVFEVIGDSMEPRLKQGDRVFVDKRMIFPNPEGIFVLWDGYSVVVKQLQIVHKSEPLKLRVLSLNPQYEPYEVLADEVNIIGRYAGRFTTD
jgi:transcriptional regulator with XRE-family HTH domain